MKRISLRQIDFMRGINSKRVEIQVTLPGSNKDIKIYIRRIARGIAGGEDNVNYFSPVEITDDSDKFSNIPIDNLGKWLWGLRNYPPHMFVDNNHNDGVLTLHYPKKVPEEVDIFMEKLKTNMEKACRDTI